MGEPENMHTDSIQSKAPTGIVGFDQCANGGLPRGRTSLLIGGPGSGKTIFALQTLVNGARQWGEPGIFVAFEENAQQIVANAASFGWDLPALEQEKLFFLDAHVSLNTITAGQFDLAGLLAGLSARVDEMGARRIVFDSVDVLLMLLDDPVLERQEVYRIHDWLAETGLTGIVTSRIGTVDPLYSERYGFMQFMADCVVQLTHRLEHRVSLRTLQIVKYRGSSFVEGEFPVVFGTRGLEVSVVEQFEPNYQVFTERVSSGIEKLDEMLKGGYYRGSSILISGSPGTAKSTLSGAFVEAACRRGERALYVSFDEATNEIVRNMASVNIHLMPFVDSGQLQMYSVHTEARSADQHLIKLKALIIDNKPHCVAVDPLSAMDKLGGGVVAMSMAERLISLAKSYGITLVVTSLMSDSLPDTEATPIAISTIADTWIHLSYLVRAGERNRALTIIKSRGTHHSNQVRELILSDDGITLKDVFISGGEVLMGTMRWEKEEEVKAARAKREDDLRRREEELAAAEAETQARMQAIKREMESLRAKTDSLKSERQVMESHWGETEDSLRHLRHGDRHILETPQDMADPDPDPADQGGA